MGALNLAMCEFMGGSSIYLVVYIIASMIVFLIISIFGDASYVINPTVRIVSDVFKYTILSLTFIFIIAFCAYSNSKVKSYNPYPSTPDTSSANSSAILIVREVYQVRN